MDDSGDHGDDLTPRDSVTHTASTPYPGTFKPDVAQMFQKMGQKLGWFEYGDINTAIKTLSRSAKKSTKAKMKNYEVKPNKLSSKGTEERNYNSKPETERKTKLSFNSDQSLSDSLKSGNDSTSYSKPIPVRKSKACTDLTRESNGKVNKLSLSAKKIPVNSKNTLDMSDKENSSPEIEPSTSYHRRKKTVRISMIPHEVGDFTSINRLSNHKSTQQEERLSVDDVQIGDPITESTRIHSRESIAQYLTRRNSFDVLDVGNPIEESTRIHSRESIAKYLPPSARNSTNGLDIGNPVTESTRIHSRESIARYLPERSSSTQSPTNKSKKLQKSPSPRKTSCKVDDISAIKNDDSSISLQINMSEESVLTSDEDSYNYLCIRGKIDSNETSDFKTMCKNLGQLDLGSALKNQGVQNQTELYTTASNAAETLSHETVFHIICESDQSEQNKSPESLLVPESDESGDDLGHMKCISQTEKNSDGSFSYVEVQDTSLQTSVQEGKFHNDKSDTEISDSENPLHFNPEKKVSNTLSKNSIIDRASRSSESSYYEVRDASLQTDQIQEDLEISPQNQSQSESENDSFDDHLYQSVAPGNSENQEIVNENNFEYDNKESSLRACIEKSRYFDAEEKVSTEESDDDFIPLKDRIKKQKSSSEERSQGEVSKVQYKLSTSTEGKEEALSSFDDSLPDLTEAKKNYSPSNHSNPTSDWRSTKTFESDSSEDDLESFFQKMKTPAKPKEATDNRKKKSNDDSLKDFIVDDMSSSSDDDIFYITTTANFPTPNRKKTVNTKPIIELSSEEEEVFKTPKVLKKVQSARPKLSKKDAAPLRNFEDTSEKKYSFLKSLTSNLQEEKCDHKALRYVKTFKKTKEELTKRLFVLYNETIFDKQLPEDLNILWNNRLLRTAGYCVYKKNAAVKGSNSVRVELSTKVCDSAERVRDTLIHELCHAAVWLLHGKNDGHGPYWRLWAQKANLTHPELPVIARCHSYSIATKFTYQCSKCGYRIGRHSKSLDTTRKVCGYCHGTFVLLSNSSARSRTRDSTTTTPATPRTPNKFAMFVKENYKIVKEREKTLKHGDIMKVLSKDFAEKNKIS